MSVNFTAEELNVLMGLLDLATKAGGLQVAQAALPVAVKVQTALNEIKGTEKPEGA